jgi:YidC/Oxa1 family membrane protein insertase
MMILLVAMFLIFRKKQEPVQNPGYKEGIYYVNVVVPERRSFMDRLAGMFKKEEIKAPDPIADVLSVTLSKDKIENIAIEKGDFYLRNSEKINTYLQKVTATGDLSYADLAVPKEEQGLYNLISSSIKSAQEKGVKRLREKTDKLPLGTFSSVVKLENGEFLEATAVISSEKIDKLNIKGSALSETEAETLAGTVKKFLDERKPFIKVTTDSGPAEKGLSEAVRNILDDTLIKDESYGIPKKSNVVYQTIKDLIAGLITGIHKVVNNYVFAIILATIVIKIIMLPLTIKQDKSMKKMKKMQPELDKLKEKYKDPQDLQRAQMELYKKHGVSFMGMGGCLLLLIQMPILIALFGVLRSGIIPEIAKAVANVFQNGMFLVSGFMSGPRFLWMDLVNPDPFYILPILTGLVTWLQQKVMSGGGEENPMMKNMTVFMPILMAFIALNMPSGVQIYWFISTILSVLQQYWIMKKGD